MPSDHTKIRVVAAQATADAFVAFLREHDGTALRVITVSGPVPRRHGHEVSVYAEVVML